MYGLGHLSSIHLSLNNTAMLLEQLHISLAKHPSSFVRLSTNLSDTRVVCGYASIECDFRLIPLSHHAFAQVSIKVRSTSFVSREEILDCKIQYGTAVHLLRLSFDRDMFSGVDFSNSIKLLSCRLPPGY
jgi:hypothetical protein